MASRIFQAFHYRDFRVMWIGACISSSGIWMQKLAQAWLVYDLSGSAFMLGLDAFLAEIPIFLFSLVGGVVADRMDRRRLLILGQVVQLSCAFILAALYFLDVLHVWNILVLSFIVGTAQSFGGPAYAALIPSLVDPEDLPNAIALNSIQFNLARAVGPALGGAALDMLGAGWCFTLNGISFFAVIWSLVVIKARFQPPKTKESIMTSMKSGFSFIRSQGNMESLIGMAFLMTVLAIPVVIFLPVMTREVFSAGSGTYSLMMAVSGCGSIAGALVVATFGGGERKGLGTLIGIVVLGLTITAFASSTNLVVSCVLLFIAGAAMISVFAMITSLVQLIATDEMRGRVMSVYNVAFRGGMPFGNLIMGELIPIYTAPTVLGISGVLLAILGVGFLFGNRRLRSM